MIQLRGVTKKYKNRIEDGGFIAFEIGYDQGEALLLIGEKEGMDCRIIKDYSGNDRVAVLSKKQ